MRETRSDRRELLASQRGRRWSWLACIGLLGACTPGAVQSVQLVPVPNKAVTTVADLYKVPGSTMTGEAPVDADKTVVLFGDSIVATLSMYELPDIYWLDVYLYNQAQGEDFTIGPSGVLLLDRQRSVFRQLAPHEAANLFLRQVEGIPPYQPKYNYHATSTTTGNASYYGNYAQYSGTTQTTVTPEEDAGHALGYSIGAAMTASRNSKLQGMANTIYATGFVESTSVAAQTGLRGGIFWLRRKGANGPVTVRLKQSGYEVTFRPGPE